MESLRCIFGHVSDMGVSIVMLNNHTVSPVRTFQLNCHFKPVHLFNIQFSIDSLVVLTLTYWVKMRSDSNIRTCHLLRQFHRGLAWFLFNQQLVLIKLNRSRTWNWRVCESKLPLLEMGKPFLCHSVDNEVISIHSINFSSSFVTLKQREGIKHAHSWILGIPGFHLKGVPNSTY